MAARAPRRRPAGARPFAGIVFLVVVVLVIWAFVELGGRLLTSSPNSSGPEPGGMALDPAAFATGSCMAFAATAGDRHKTVFLDAGHGGIDPGGVGSTQGGRTVYESDATLPAELDAMALLRAEGYRVVVSRTRDTTVLRLGPADVSGGVLSLQGAHGDVVARDRCANDAGAGVLVGIYFDAGAAAGSLTAYDAARPFAAANLEFANELQADVLHAMNAQGWDIPDDGVSPDTALGSYVGDPSGGGIAGEAASYDHLLVIGPAKAGYFTTPSKMPGAVIEPLYLTDPFEGTIAASAHGEAVIARGVATAVEAFLAPPAKAG